MVIGQHAYETPELVPDTFSYRDAFLYQELCYKTKAFAEHIAESMNLMDQKRADYVLSILETMVFYPNDDALVDRALCDLYHSGITEGRESVEQMLTLAKTQAHIRVASGF
ncbi:MAG: ATPase inhibitor subunit zeta [Alphaproteobacteria bacterium]